MKKTFIAVAAAVSAMAFTAVSCSNKKEENASVAGNTTAAETVSTEETAEEVTVDAEAEGNRQYMKGKAEEGVDITVQPFPECGEIPDDWKEISYESVSMRIPPDFEEEENAAHYIKKTYGKKDSFETAYIVEKMKFDNGLIKNYTYPEITEEVVANAFKELGIDYDGTPLSTYKAVLSLTSEMRTDQNAESFEQAMLAKEIFLSDSSEVFYKQINGHEVYIKKAENGSDGFWCFSAELFVNSKESYSVEVIGDTLEDALKMCSTISIS